MLSQDCNSRTSDDEDEDEDEEEEEEDGRELGMWY